MNDERFSDTLGRWTSVQPVTRFLSAFTGKPLTLESAYHFAIRHSRVLLVLAGDQKQFAAYAAQVALPAAHARFIALGKPLPTRAPNTLVIRTGQFWDRDDIATLERCFTACAAFVYDDWPEKS